MTSTKHASERRPPVQIRRRGRPTAHPIEDWRRGRAGALILSLPQHGARAQPAPPAWSSLTTKAAATLTYGAGYSLPALLLGFVSWAVAELLFGFAAYAETMYSPPPPAEPRDEDQPSREERRVSWTRLAAVCWSRLRQAQGRRRAIEELRGLDDRSLRDIGILRSDIETIVRYGARRE